MRKGVYRVSQKKDSGKHKDLRNLNSEVSVCTMVCVLGGGGGGGRERREGGISELLVLVMAVRIFFNRPSCLTRLLSYYNWMDDLQVYVIFNSISVISGRWADDYERLYAMELCLRLQRSSPQAGLEATTARSVGQSLTH